MRVDNFYRREPLTFLQPKLKSKYATPTARVAVMITKTPSPKSVTAPVTRLVVDEADILRTKLGVNNCRGSEELY